jgi:hypothetical protein
MIIIQISRYKLILNHLIKYSNTYVFVGEIEV